MKKTILGTRTINEKYKPSILYVAWETEPGFCKVTTLSGQGYSEYVIQRAVESGREVSIQKAQELFPELSTYKYDFTPLVPPTQDQLSSLSDLYEQAKDLVYHMLTLTILPFVRCWKSLSRYGMLLRPRSCARYPSTRLLPLLSLKN